MTKRQMFIGGVAIVVVVFILYNVYTEYESTRDGGDGSTGTGQPDENMLKKTASDGICNPGNLRQNSVVFMGELRQPFEFRGAMINPLNNQFKSFISMSYGYRAMVRVLRSYVNKGYKTLTQIINRYAPSTENNTNAYIQYVSQRAGIDPNADLTTLINGPYVSELIKHMVRLEQGANFVIDENDIRTGVNLA